MDLGRVGVWTRAYRADGGGGARADFVAAVAELEELGYGTVWVGSSSDSRDVAPLLAATSRIVVATGILNIWWHEPGQVAAEHAALTAAHPGRFLLGLGASHARIVDDPAIRRP